MDSLTHAVAGLAIAWTEPSLLQIAPGSIEEKAIFWASLLGSEAPDIDFLFRFSGSVNFLKYHRVITHSIFVLPILALIITLMLIPLFSLKVFGLIFCTAFISIVGHVLLDLLTAYGTVLYWPLKHRAYAWDILMIIDPVFVGIPLTAKTLAVLNIVSGKTTFFSGLILIFLYLLTKFVIHAKIINCLVKQYQPYRKIAVLPNYLGILKWKFIIQLSDRYILGAITFPSYSVEELNQESSSVNFPSEFFQKAASSTTAKAFLNFAKFPLLRYQKVTNGHLFQWMDLRFRFKGYNHFLASVLVTPLGKIKAEALGDRGKEFFEKKD